MTYLCNCSRSGESLLEINRKVNNLTEESCKACGGIFLVDQIESVCLEAMDSISPELNWKPVKKGKRSRKPIARTLNEAVVLGNKSPKRVGDFSGSESEKFGEAGIGQLSSHKTDVPIKKRRHLVKSPSRRCRALSTRCGDSLSPKQNSSELVRDDEHLSDQNWSRDQRSLNSCSSSKSKDFNGLATGKLGKTADDGGEIERGPLNSEDFSGIDLLAAAACINSMEDSDNMNRKDCVLEDSTTLEHPNTCMLQTHLKMGVTLMESQDLSNRQKADGNTESTDIANNSATDSQKLHENVKSGAIENYLKVDRRHWDLNALIDEWAEPYEPCDDTALGNNDSLHVNNYVSAEKFEGEYCGRQENSEFSAHAYPLGMRVESSKLKKEVNEQAALSEADGTCEERKHSPNGDGYLFEPSKCVHADMKICDQATKEDSYNKPVLGFNKDARAEASDQVINKTIVDNPSLEDCSSKTFRSKEDVSTAIVMQDEDSSSNLIEFNRTTSSEVILVTAQKVSQQEVSVLRKSVSTNDMQTEKTEDYPQKSELPDSVTLKVETTNFVAVKNLDFDSSGSNSIELGCSRPLASSSKFSVLDPFHHDNRSTEIAGSKGQEGIISVAPSVISDPQEQLEPKEIAVKNEERHTFDDGAKRIILQDPCISSSGKPKIDGNMAPGEKIGLVPDGCHETGFLLSNDDHIGDGNDMSRTESGYDSPFEDGELRGSVLYSWEENGMDDIENECVDYESDGRNGDHSDAADYPGSETAEDGYNSSRGTEKRLVPMEAFPVGDLSKNGSMRRHLMKEDPKKHEKSGKKESNAGSGSTIDMELVDENYVSARRKYIGNQRDIADGNESCDDEFGSRTRGKMHSRIEGLSSLDATNGKATYLQRFRSRRFGGSYSRPERGTSTDKYLDRHRSADHVSERDGVGQWTYWGSRNRYSSNYHGPESRGRPRPRNVMDDSTEKFGGMDFHDHRPHAYSSKGLHKSFIRRRSPLDESDCFGVHRGMRLSQSSNNRNRGVDRGFREDFREPIPEDGTASVRLGGYFSRRDRSFSPGSGRGTHLPFASRKSRSRSRSRSPRQWHPQRERNFGMRPPNRSSDFRSGSRVERVRTPFSKPSFTSDYGEGYMSQPRARFSPHRNSRCFNDRSFADSDMRNRRSPVRTFRWHQKFDTVGSSGRFRSDDYFRPMVRRGRFSLIDGDDRESKFENGYEEKRYSNKSEMINRGKHSDDVGNSSRQFPHDAANDFETTDTTNDDVRDTDLRDVPQSDLEDKI